MARSSGKACKYMRREGTDLFLKTKGKKTKKFESRPGQHGSKSSRLSNYGRQLREKQKIKRIYGVHEAQFRNYYHEASRKKGATGDIILRFLESRLDNIVYRGGLAATRPEARQLVSHGGVLVDGKRVDIPSYRVAAGSKISLSEKAKAQVRVKEALALFQQKPSIDWIKTDMADKSVVFTRLPWREELSQDLNEQLVVELYSK